MSQPFIATIEPFPYNFAPKNWSFCAGQILSISQNAALFSLLGTTFGGNGTTTFALPNLIGRVAVGIGQGPGLSNYVWGQVGGVESVALSVLEMPSHVHPVAVTANGQDIAADEHVPGGNIWAGDTNSNFFVSPAGAGNPMDPKGLTVVAQQSGGNVPHENCMPTLALNYCICLYGIFPSRG